MTPNEKAAELVAKFAAYTLSYRDEYAAKQCALIAVELVLSTRAYSEDLSGYDKTYYEQMKAEIEKI